MRLLFVSVLMFQIITAIPLFAQTTVNRQNYIVQDTIKVIPKKNKRLYTGCWNIIDIDLNTSKGKNLPAPILDYNPKFGSVKLDSLSPNKIWIKPDTTLFDLKITETTDSGTIRQLQLNYFSYPPVPKIDIKINGQAIVPIPGGGFKFSSERGFESITFFFRFEEDSVLALQCPYFHKEDDHYYFDEIEIRKRCTVKPAKQVYVIENKNKESVITYVPQSFVFNKNKNEDWSCTYAFEIIKIYKRSKDGTITEVSRYFKAVDKNIMFWLRSR